LYLRGGGEGGGDGGGEGGGDGGGAVGGGGGGGLGGDGGGAGGGEGGGGQLILTSLTQSAGGGEGGGEGGHIEISAKFCHVDGFWTQFEHRYDQNGFTEHGTLMAKSALLSSISKLEKLDAANWLLSKVKKLTLLNWGFLEMETFFAQWAHASTGNSSSIISSMVHLL
jgi:hypothetical protein